jgi:hypothetical protein
MKLHMRLPAPGSAEAQLTVRALEGLGSCVQAHVDLQTSLCGEGIAAHVAAEQLLTCGEPVKGQQGLRPPGKPTPCKSFRTDYTQNPPGASALQRIWTLACRGRH